eukprot:896184-Amphidinium_carterae.1
MALWSPRVGHVGMAARFSVVPEQMEGLLLKQRIDESLPSERYVRHGRPDADELLVAFPLQLPHLATVWTGAICPRGTIALVPLEEIVLMFERWVHILHLGHNRCRLRRCDARCGSLNESQCRSKQDISEGSRYQRDSNVMCN